MLQTQPEMNILLLTSIKKHMFHYSIAPFPIPSIYVTEINDLEMDMQKHLEKSRKVHTDTC